MTFILWCSPDTIIIRVCCLEVYLLYSQHSFSSKWREASLSFSTACMELKPSGTTSKCLHHSVCNSPAKERWRKMLHKKKKFFLQLQINWVLLLFKLQRFAISDIMRYFGTYNKNSYISPQHELLTKKIYKKNAQVLLEESREMGVVQKNPHSVGRYYYYMHIKHQPTKHYY